MLCQTEILIKNILVEILTFTINFYIVHLEHPQSLTKDIKAFIFKEKNENQKRSAKQTTVRNMVCVHMYLPTCNSKSKNKR